MIMSLDDYSLSESDRTFFEKASMMIYEWLSEEEKLKLNMELIDEGFSNINDLSIKERLFRLLNFLEVKYIRAEEWIRYTLNYLEAINGNSQTNTRIEDVEIKLIGERNLSISQMAKKFLDKSLKESFTGTLKELGLEKEYKRYIAKLEGMPNE